MIAKRFHCAWYRGSIPSAVEPFDMALLMSGVGVFTGCAATRSEEVSWLNS
jgi:hypothetical protein